LIEEVMSIDAVLAANRAAVSDLISALERMEDGWDVPTAPGKWSPSQLAEHVARALEAGGNQMYARPSNLITLPAFVRPVARALVFNRVLSKGAFPKAKTNPAMNPDKGQESPSKAAVRLLEALTFFEEACREGLTSGPNFVSSAFGLVGIEDYARFQEIHTRHHMAQLPD
jgi:hypothetical protein